MSPPYRIPSSMSEPAHTGHVQPEAGHGSSEQREAGCEKAWRPGIQRPATTFARTVFVGELGFIL